MPAPVAAVQRAASRFRSAETGHVLTSPLRLRTREDASEPPPFESVYAAQLRRGFRRLRFELDLEKEFRGYFNQANRTRVRFILLFGALILLVFAVHNLDTHPAPLGRTAFLIQSAVLTPCLLLTWAATYAGRLRERLPLLALIGLGVVTAGLLAIYAQARRHELYFPYEGMLLVLMVAYFTAGLFFRQAVGFGLTLLAAYIVNELLWRTTPSDHLAQYALYLTSANVIGAVGAYAHEYSRRHEFLAARQLHSEANRDGLTGLHNRRFLDEHLPRLWGQAKRNRTRIAAAFFDVDYFKEYNDAHGHLAGDDCLRSLAAVFASEARRPLDIAVRYGGEEFLLVWFDLAPAEALTEVVERVRRHVADLRLPHPGSAVSDHVTVSGGAAATVPTPEQDPTRFLECADEALYQAKKDGRNRAVTIPYFDGPDVADHSAARPDVR